MHTVAAPDPLVLGPLFGVGRRLYTAPASDSYTRLANPDFALAVLHSAREYRYTETVYAVIEALDPYVQAITDHQRRRDLRRQSRRI